MCTLDVLIREIREKKYNCSQKSAVQFGFNNVSFTYNDKSKHVFENASFSISTTGLFLFKGGNGTGKTTIFKLLSKLVEPQLGTINTCNDDSIAYSSANGHDANLYIKCHKFLSECLGELSIEYLDKVLKSLELQENKEQRILTLSSGQRKKLSIFRAFISSKNSMFLDEPLSHFDTKFQKFIIDEIKILKNNMNILISTHEDLFDDQANNVFLIENKKINGDKA